MLTGCWKLCLTGIKCFHCTLRANRGRAWLWDKQLLRPFLDEAEHVPTSGHMFGVSQAEGGRPLLCPSDGYLLSFHPSFCELPHADLATWKRWTRTSSSISLFLPVLPAWWGRALWGPWPRCLETWPFRRNFLSLWRTPAPREFVSDPFTITICEWCFFNHTEGILTWNYPWALLPLLTGWVFLTSHGW